MKSNLIEALQHISSNIITEEEMKISANNLVKSIKCLLVLREDSLQDESNNFDKSFNKKSRRWTEFGCTE